MSTPAGSGAEADTVVAAYSAAEAIVAAARKYGCLPSLRSPDFVTAPLIVRLAVLAVCGASYVLAEEMLDTWANQNHPGGPFHRQNNLPVVTELQRRRYPPNGDRDAWIRYGAAGPPPEHSPPEEAA